MASEKLKLIADRETQAADNELPSVLKDIDKRLGPHIRARGSTFHEWSSENQTVKFLKMVEIINRGGGAHVPPQLKDIDGHYKDTKWLVRRDILSGLEFMHEIDLIVRTANAFNSLCDDFEKACSRPSQKEMTPNA